MASDAGRREFHRRKRRFIGNDGRRQRQIEKRCDELMKNAKSPFAVPTARRCLETQISSVCVQQNKGGHIKIQSGIIAALVIIAAIAPLQAEAKGCIKGAIVGGIAGHMAGHGKVGAAAGCVVGHHEANKPRSNQQGQSAEPPK
jgi:hypothetical protein